MKSWAISTNKGGVLKTSLTTNLAGVLAKDKRVLIVDTDNQGNVCLSFGINPDSLEQTIYDVLVGGIPAEKAIVTGYTTEDGTGRIDILPSNDDMAFFEFDVLSHPEKFPKPFELLRRSMQSVQDRYDYILIDTPPNLGLSQGNVLTYCDEVLIPFQPENYSMRSLVKIMKAIESFRDRHNPSLSVLGVLATLVDTRTTLHSEVLQQCRRFCFENNIRMFDTVIPKSIRYATSVAYDRLPATLTTKNTQLIAPYYDLIKELREVESIG